VTSIGRSGRSEEGPPRQTRIPGVNRCHDGGHTSTVGPLGVVNVAVRADLMGTQEREKAEVSFDLSSRDASLPVGMRAKSACGHDNAQRAHVQPCRAMSCCARLRARWSRSDCNRALGGATAPRPGCVHDSFKRATTALPGDDVRRRRRSVGRRAASAPMRVAMIGSGWFPDEIGGLDRYFTSLFTALRDVRLTDPTAVVMGPVAEPPPGVRVPCRSDDAIVRRAVAGVRAARNIDADVVDAHFALYSLLPVTLSRLRHARLVVHFHGPWADESRHAGRGSWARLQVKHRVERAVYCRADRCVVLTHAFKRVLVERYGVSPWRVAVEPPGVDVDRFALGDREAARAALGLADDAMVVSCVRRLVPRMGHDALLDAWKTVVARSDRGALLVIAGDGPLRPDLEARVAAEGLESSVRLLGRVDDEALVRLYQAADVNVVPSVALEGFGLVVLEAAACGTPSVVTRVGGLPEAVHGLDASLIVEPGSPEALAERLLAPLPTRIRAREFAEAHSWRAVGERHADIYEAIATPEGSRKRRVVYLDHTARMSGGEIALLRLLPHLSGVEPHVILAEPGPFADALIAEGISVEVIPMSTTARRATRGTMRLAGLSPRVIFGSAIYTVRIARRLRALHPDLVHTNSLKAGVYGGVAARSARVPQVWHVRDRIAPDYLPRQAVAAIRFLIARLASGCIANSQATLRTLGTPGRAVVLTSVVPEVTQRAPTSPTPDRHRGTVFGMVGRLAQWKGQDVFLRAFARAFPSGEQRAVVVGSAMFGGEDEQYAAGLVDLVGELGIADRVDFRGFRDDVSAELAGMDVIVHASTVPEPFGQVVVEGMACGLAVVASAAGGPLEIITRGTDGELFPPGDVEHLASLLVELDADPARRARLGEAGIRRSLDFRPEPVAAGVERFYELVLDHDQAARRSLGVDGRVTGGLPQ
jgi:glycosyltransferase involved in cell wall biosynthesis